MLTCAALLDASPHSFPTSLEMFEASLFEVIDGAGKSWAFGDLIKDQKTIVVFIRHWYCPLCQGAASSARFVRRQAARGWSSLMALPRTRTQTTCTRSSRTSTRKL